ncbi:hypothetical protein J3Q00_07405 [Pseudomonas sp. D2-3]
MRVENVNAWCRRNFRLLAVTPAAVVVLFFTSRWAVGLPWGSTEAPAWVQAVGSVVAIFAAWLIPHYHEAARLRRIKNDMYDSAGWLAIRIGGDLGYISGSLDRARLEPNEEEVFKAWRDRGALTSSEIHNKAAAELPIEHFSGEDISILFAIRDAAGFAEECSRVLYEWDFKRHPLISEAFPLYDRLSYHLTQISWATRRTYGRPESKLPNVKGIERHA